MKFTRFLLLTLALLASLVACQSTKQQGQQEVPPSQLADSRQITPGPFNKVVIDGPYDVELIGGAEQDDARLIGTREDIYRVRVKLEGDTLHLTKLSGVMGKQRLLAVIRVKQLYDLKYKGSGRVTAIGLDAPWLNAHLQATGNVSLSGKAMHLRQLDLDGHGVITLNHVMSQGLVINSKGEDKLYLNGETNLQKLMVGGKAWLKSLWIDSPTLVVRASNDAHIELAGVVGVLDAQIHDKARFNARYLRTRRSYVKTYNQAQADLQVTQVQNTLASDQSNIYFYKSPRFVGSHMAQNGAVLNMNGMR